MEENEFLIIQFEPYLLQIIASERPAELSDNIKRFKKPLRRETRKRYYNIIEKLIIFIINFYLF